MNKFESFLNNRLLPILAKMQNNKILGALSEGFIRTSPATIGSAFILILANFPIPAWLKWLQDTNLAPGLAAVSNASIGLMGLFAVYNIAFAYAKKLGAHSQNAGLIALASYFILIPQQITTHVNEGGKWIESSVNAVKFDYLGGQGIFVGMIVAILVTRLFAFLSTKNLTIKLPESVPPMVSDSLAPTFIVTAIFMIVCAIRIAFSFTQFHDVFTLITQVISAPLNSLMANPISMIFIQVLVAFLWFFGIHNAVISGPLSAVTLTMMTTNIDAYTAGTHLPFAMASMVYGVGGAAGNALGLVICLMFAKSARYKQMFKLGALPTIFNITEPLNFGIPTVLNPIFFFPLVLSPLIAGFTSWGLMSTVLTIPYNPTAEAIPWTTPGFVKFALIGGWKFLLIYIIITAIVALIWFPFVKFADMKELKEEKSK
ncbi:PTS sugar transporter subunit IIC [Lapidilactobacillus mulanensis]|uniref:Permease IIC component n=1 Tax=Lapidilactobacillus mulanensis TaxID=2485999 RepID=A0ABW4DKZ3_9LACO|nr:PTS transporter subunit EIIC [Lapidilactobacillus mulanensis]